ncbi:Stf0 family sulfotransferase [Paramylibacter kogurei]|nr:Stf0 family sulfotransferase [Amylibacter kogurei]
MNKLTLVLATQRSGSTLLCKDMIGLGGLGLPKEHFKRLFGEHKKAEAKGNPLPRSEKDIVDFLRENGCSDDNPDVAGVKLMVGQSPMLCNFLGLPTSKDKSVTMQSVIDWAYANFDAVNLVVIIRESVLDQCISRAVARSTSVYHHRDTKRMKDVDPYEGKELDLDALNQMIIDLIPRVAKDNEVLHQIAKNNAGRALLVDYDYLAQHPNEAQQKLFDHAVANGFTPKKNQFDRILRKLIDKSKSQEIRASFEKFASEGNHNRKVKKLLETIK